ncbi:MAG: hypothetical protein ACHQNE_04930, partial [Candidatus Kapaibacterium sp.]
MIERRWSLALLLTACLFPASNTNAQPSGIAARMLFPPRNYEIALGDSITPMVRIWNWDTIPHGGGIILYRVGNVATGISVYSRTITLPNILPGDSLDTTFVPYPTGPQILAQLGTFHACLIVGNDTVCTRLFGVRRTAVPYIDPSNDYSHTSFGDIPDQTLWISEGATIVDGEDSTWDPPPPRNSSGYGPNSFISPVIRLDRTDETGKFYSGSDVGDTLNSFPINMQGKTRMIFKFDYMRAGRHHYPLGWDDSLMFGPESTILDSAGNIVRSGDSLILEFKKPSAPEVNPSASDWNEIATIDGGHDFEFKSFFARPVAGGWQIRIDNDTCFLTDTSNYFTNNFRFRFRLKEKDDGMQASLPKDDADAWYIDNPAVELPLLPELEVRWVRVVNPYTKVPQSQAVFPVFVKVLNYGSDNGVGFPIRVKIFDPNSHIVYDQEIVTDQAFEGQDTLLRFPDWDASNQTLLNGFAYLITASLDQPGYDEYSDDDSTYTKFFLNVEANAGAIQEFAYDDAGLTPQSDGGNDIPKLTGIPRSGIGFDGTTGSVAMKFQLARMDSIYGVRVYFSSANQSPDPVRISLVKADANSCEPYGTVLATLDAERGGQGFDQFWPYYFPRPIILDGGASYWIVVSQLSTHNMELGGDVSRGGAETRQVFKFGPEVSSVYAPEMSGSTSYGTQWGNAPDDNSGDVNCTWATQSPLDPLAWSPLMPDYNVWPAMYAPDGIRPLVHFSDSIPFTGAGTYA